MAVLDLVFLLGLPSIATAVAWASAIKNLPRPVLLHRASDGSRNLAPRLVLLLLPCVLPILGLTISLLMLDRGVGGGIALQPAAVAYGVPATFAGLGVALVYARCIGIAVGTRTGLSRVLPVVSTPMPGCVFGALTAFIMLSLNQSGGPGIGSTSDAQWWASLAAAIGGAGSFAVVSLTRAKWDFRTALGWVKTMGLVGWGVQFYMIFFAVAMVLLEAWVIVFLIVGFSGFSLLGGVIRVKLARNRRTSVNRD